MLNRLLRAGVLTFALTLSLVASAGDWPQFRGPTTDGISAEPLPTPWPTVGPRIVWTNMTLTNGFSTFAVSQGRAFTMISKVDEGGVAREYCAAVDAATGAFLWESYVDRAAWDPNSDLDGGEGAGFYNTGDGPRTTPTVVGGRVLAFSGYLRMVCFNATNGAGLWTNNLVSTLGGSIIVWENCASPLVDGDLVYVNLNSSANNQNLAALRVSDGSLAWKNLSEKATHTTPIITTIDGVRQVIFATQSGLVSLNRTNGAFLWKYPYPFSPISTSMGASPVAHSNIVFCTASYGRGSAAARVAFTNNQWTVQHLYYKSGANYRSIWMTPVCVDGYIYTLTGDNTTFLTTPLNCIELATGNLMWSTNNFGMGGLILVGGKLLILTEDGQLVTANPSPAGYEELARFQAFHFSEEARGKCWISPAFSDGRIYARSTRGGICLDPAAAIPALPALKLSAPRFLNGTDIELRVSTADGSPLDPARLARISIRVTDTPGSQRWAAVTNSLVSDVLGQARVTFPATRGPRHFYYAVETP